MKTAPRKVSQKRLHLGGRRRRAEALACDSPSRGDTGVSE